MFGDAVAVSGEQILVGEGRNLLLPGNVFVYDRDANGMWTQSRVLEPEVEEEAALGYGRALAATDNMLAVGAPLQKAVYLYARDENNDWKKQSVLQSTVEDYGNVLAINGGHLLIGSDGIGGAEGSVHAYILVEDSWEYSGLIEMGASARMSGDISSIAVSGNHAVVGRIDSDRRRGAVYAYQYNATENVWKEIEKITIEGLEQSDFFGYALVIENGTLAVGAPRKGPGTVALFDMNDEGLWEQRGDLLPGEEAEDELFGSALAYSNGALLVGAPGKNQNRGTTYVFPSMSMDSVEEILPETLQFRSNYGDQLAASGDLVVVGARGHDNFEGVAFPISTADGTVSLGAPLYNDAEFASITGNQVTCEEGQAAEFPCSDVDMLSFLTRREIGARRGIQVNDVWGWEDPETGREYALVGRTDGTSFIDLTDPALPLYVGDLPKTSTANQSLWRDIKVYRDHAFIVADGAGAHHMQIFDLSQLRDVDVANMPMTFTETALYKEIYSSHNLIINEETGFAYAVGNSSGGETCGGALHMIDIRDPLSPVFAGCFVDKRTGRRGSGGTHDAQCVTYIGPDADYRGHEICLSSNGTALSIADVTDKDNPEALSVVDYPQVAYTHQGWLTEDHRYFYLNDEGDEASELVSATRTLIFDVADLDDPLMVSQYLGPSSAIDHNLYIKDNIMYQTNYVEGLRLVDITDPENPAEIGHFDTVPYGPNDNSPVLGAWSNYPYFKSGVIVVTSGREGVFFLKKKSVDI